MTLAVVKVDKTAVTPLGTQFTKASNRRAKLISPEQSNFFQVVLRGFLYASAKIRAKAIGICYKKIQLRVYGYFLQTW